MVVLTFLVGTFFYVMSRILELKNTTLHATLVVFNTVKKTQYVVIFDRNSSHTVFFRKHDIRFVRRMWYIIIPTWLTYTHVPQTRHILHRLYSHNNVKVLSLGTTLSTTLRVLVHLHLRGLKIHKRNKKRIEKKNTWYFSIFFYVELPYI